MSRIKTWELRFLHLAREVSTWSKDPSTKTGAVITDHNHNIISQGYNGFPRKMKDTASLYADRETKYSRIIHCEMNAVLTANGPVKGCILYTWPFLSCDRCAVHMVQAGIHTVVAPKLPAHLYDRWQNSVNKSKSYFQEAGVRVIEHDIDWNDPHWSV